MQISAYPDAYAKWESSAWAWLAQLPEQRASGDRRDAAASQTGCAGASAYTRTVSVNTTDPMIGRLIDGRYQVRSRIARGGMATVYLATDLRLERRVADQDHARPPRRRQPVQGALHPGGALRRAPRPPERGRTSSTRARTPTCAYLVMEYLPGITLRDLLQEHGSLTTEQTIDILEAVLAGLAAAHKAGHRAPRPQARERAARRRRPHQDRRLRARARGIRRTPRPAPRCSARSPTSPPSSSPAASPTPAATSTRSAS